VPRGEWPGSHLINGGFGGVGASGGCGPAEDAGFGLFECPAGGLLDAVVVSAGRYELAITTQVVRPDQEGSQRQRLPFFSQVIASPFCATPVTPWSAVGQNSPAL